MQKLLILLVCFFALDIDVALAEITTTSTLAPIEKAIEQADSQTLVVFDVDDVLIMPTNGFAFKAPIRKELVKALKSKYSKSQLKFLWSIIFQTRTVKLVDPSILNVIKKLELRKIPTIALTGWWTGNYGQISNMEDWRFKDLRQVGISFINTSPFKENLTFPELKTEEGIPMLKEGIIFTALSDKGIVLKKVLQKAKTHFKKIIFIDDELANLEAVQQAVQSLGVKFLGIYYTAVKLVPLPQCNREREVMRFNILEQEHKWLSDEEADKRINQGKDEH